MIILFSAKTLYPIKFIQLCPPTKRIRNHMLLRHATLRHFELSVIKLARLLHKFSDIRIIHFLPSFKSLSLSLSLSLSFSLRLLLLHLWLIRLILLQIKFWGNFQMNCIIKKLRKCQKCNFHERVKYYLTFLHINFQSFCLSFSSKQISLLHIRIPFYSPICCSGTTIHIVPTQGFTKLREPSRLNETQV